MSVQHTRLGVHGAAEETIGRWFVQGGDPRRGASEGSLRRLQTGGLVQQGKIVCVGPSRVSGWDIATACREASRRGMTGLVSEQSPYSLDNRRVELEVVRACRHYGPGLIPGSPPAGGLSGGASGRAGGGRRKDASLVEQSARHRSRLERYQALCKELGEAPEAHAW